MRQAIRSLFANGRFPVISIATFGLTIAAVSVVSTLLYSVLLKPLPYPDPERLVILWERQPQFPTLRTVRTADFVDWRRRSQAFESMGLYRTMVSTIDTDTAPLRVQLSTITPAIFETLGAQIALGRGLMDKDERDDGETPIVISYALWQSRFGSSPDVIGKTLKLSQDTVGTIVGIAALGFHLPVLASTPRLTSSSDPMEPEIWQAHRPSGAEFSNRLRGGYVGIARLKPGVTTEQANDEIAAIAKQLSVDYPDTNIDVTAGASLLIHEVAGSYRSLLWIFFGAVLCLLLIGLGNVANIQTIRLARRDREISIRLALGASKRRVLRQLVAEGVLMSTIGCLLGLLAAIASITILRQSLPAGFPRLAEIRMDTPTVLFSVIVSVVAGAVCSALPALRISVHNLNEALKGTFRNQSAEIKRSRMLRTFVGFEAALAMVLLIVAGLLANSLFRLVTTDTGMNETNVRTAAMTLPPRYKAPADQSAFFLSALERVRNLPEIQYAALVSMAPLAGMDLMLPNSSPEDRAVTSNRGGVTLSLRMVTPQYFDVMGLSPIQGRLLADSDTMLTDHVAVLNESAARALWPNDDPIGRRIIGGRRYTVVGVIRDVKMRRLDTVPSPQIYSNFLQEPVGTEMPVTLVTRAKDNGVVVGTRIRDAIRSLDHEVNTTVLTMKDVRWSITSAERFRTTVILIFAWTALFLALLGTAGVVGFTVSHRQRELGLRVALGATPATVLRMVVRQSLKPAAIGVVIGVILSMWTTRLVAGFLYDVQQTDALTFAFVSTLLIGSIVLASYVAARRVLRLDPAVVLRHE